jgi:hypothetical protein
MQDAPEQPRSAASQNVCTQNMLRAAGKDLPGPRHPPTLQNFANRLTAESRPQNLARKDRPPRRLAACRLALHVGRAPSRTLRV